MPRSEIAPVEVVYVKELAQVSGVCEKTILRRLRRWEVNPGDALGIPYLVKLGKPYRIPVSVVRDLLSVGRAA